MKRFHLLLLFISMSLSILSCRETEMNTDGDMEENDSTKEQVESEGE